MRFVRGFVWVIVWAIAGCGAGSHRDRPSDGDADSDTDADTDADSDSDTESDDLPCTVLDADTWRTETVDAEGETGRYPSIAFSGGVPFIGYHSSDDAGGGDARIATDLGDGWELSDVDVEGDGGRYSMQVRVEQDATVVHVLYSDSSDDDLRYARGLPGAWEIETIAVWPVGGGSSLDLDSNDAAHVLYSQSVARELRYMTNASGAWVEEVVETGCSWAPNASVEVGTGDDVHVVFGCDDVQYGVRPDGAEGWTFQTVDPTLYTRVTPSLALDANGAAHVAYTLAISADATPELRYATNVSGVWTTETPKFIAGEWASLALDGAATPHVAYYDSDTGDLGYLRRVGPAWIVQQIDSEGDTGLYPSIAIAGRAVHVAYHDATAGDLRYATASCSE